jgi:hypothetical protein
MYDRTAGISVRMGPSLTSLTQADTDRLRREGANVYIKEPGEDRPTLLVANAQFTGLSGSNVANILVSAAEHARLSQAYAAQKNIFLELPPANPFGGLWLSQPVFPDQFNEVGHALFTLLLAWLGGALGRQMYTTRAMV